MKIILLIAVLLSSVVCSQLFGQEYSRENVMSYYAMGNSLDGQPMIETANVLRFYPVFALQRLTEQVVVTVYYGSYIYTDTARSMDGGHYWEARLPQFHLGESIQRIDVRTTIDIKDYPLYSLYRQVQDMITVAQGHIATSGQALLQSANITFASANADLAAGVTGQIEWLKDEFRNALYRQAEGEALSVPGCDPDYLYLLLCELRTLCRKIAAGEICVDRRTQYNLQEAIAEAQRLVSLTDTPKKKSSPGVSAALSPESSQILDTFRTRIDMLPGILAQKTVAEISQVFNAAAAGEVDKILALVHLRDSLRSVIAGESYEHFFDTNFSGPSVRKGDVLFNDMANGKVEILYRNHKTSLRQLPALDPVESMGIFRARYIPFVVLGKEYQTTFTGNEGAVFEIGLAFGDVHFAGDDFVKPELSIRRLGVAFAVTNELFSDEASIRALAFTYDFNAYGSIGAGANFPGTGGVESYFSFGINKKAFEALLKGIASVFK